MAKEPQKGIDFRAAGRKTPKGLNYLLAVAINEYEHHNKLSNCVRDAEQLVKVLHGRYGFRPDETTTLFDKDATAANLYKNLVELSKKVTPQDNVIIYFSGHGFFDRSDHTGHLVTVEASEGAVWQYFSNANLVNRIRAINSFHTFLIVDSCFSGSLFASKEVSATPFAEKVEGLPSRWALAAGQIETVEDGLHGDHSPFAKALLAFLEKNSSPLVPASELIQHVKRVTPHNARQTPVGGVLFKTGDVGGEFVFHLKQDEVAAWAEAKAANTLAGYRQFLEAFPESNYVQEARKQIAGLEEEAAWNRAKTINTLAAYDDYLDAYPQGRYAEEAEERMEALDEEKAWRQAVARASLVGFRKYLRAYPAGKYSGEARERIQELKVAPDPEPEPTITKKAEEPPPKPTPPPREKPAEKKQHISLKDMVFIEGGSFEMGDLFGDGEEDEKPVHTVKLSDFYLCRFQVTVEEFSRFVEATGYKTDAEKGDGSYFWEGQKWIKKAGINWRHDAAGKLRSAGEYNHPVVHVSWNDAIAYCNWLSEQHGYEKVYSVNGGTVTANWNANGYRLPTEAEWEYAARSRGKKYKYAWGNSSTPHANIADESAKKQFPDWTIWEGYDDGYVYTSPVGKFEQGDLGLSDMIGNVWEWCWDWYDKNYYEQSKNSRDPKGPDSGSPRVLRGGSWYFVPANARCALRDFSVPGVRSSDRGFRLARAGR